MNSNRKCQPDIHPTGVRLHWLVYEAANLCKALYLRKPSNGLLFAQSHNCRIQEYILVSGKLRIKARTQLEQGSHPAVEGNLTFGRLQRSRDHLKQGAFSRSVFADDAECAASWNSKTDIL